jgi:hypothetical protein
MPDKQMLGGNPFVPLMNEIYRQFMLAVLVVALAASLINCAQEKKLAVAPPKNTIVLKYQDFGPQIMSHELIGMEWYQWNSQGPDDPNARDDVKVVVYRNLPLDEVKKRYPVVEQKQDYRYLGYQAALNLLNKYEANPFWNEYPDTKEKMKQTREKVLEQLGT